MGFEPARHDVHVFKSAPGVKGVRLQFFVHLSSIERIVVADTPWLAIAFVEGGRVEMPEATAVWIEPERH